MPAQQPQQIPRNTLHQLVCVLRVPDVFLVSAEVHARLNKREGSAQREAILNGCVCTLRCYSLSCGTARPPRRQFQGGSTVFRRPDMSALRQRTVWRLLYEPGPLDRWISRNIGHDWRSRKFVIAATTGAPGSLSTGRRGNPLTLEDTSDYKRYIHEPQAEVPTSWNTILT